MANANVTSGASAREQALDELYASSPAAFTAKRDALAKALKAAGEVAGASELEALRKPTQIAYVLNQLARRHADVLADLVDVGRELARAQRKTLRGEAGSDLRDAIARQRSVVAGLTAKTATLMAELGVPTTGHRDEVASALQAALVDPAVGAKLEEGRLDKVPAPAAGFPGASPQETEPELAPAKAVKAVVKAKESAKANVHAPAEEKQREALATKERREAERAEKAAAARTAAASSAGNEATERAPIADDAERDADGLAAQAKKLDEEARGLASEAKRLAAEPSASRATRRSHADTPSAPRPPLHAPHAQRPRHETARRARRSTPAAARRASDMKARARRAR
jgi:hypothetical protein